MTTYMLPALVALQSADEGLTGNEIIQALPRDPVSIFALLLIVVGAGAVLWLAAAERGPAALRTGPASSIASRPPSLPGGGGLRRRRGDLLDGPRTR